MRQLSKITTTLPREEAWDLDDIAQRLGVRRSHVMRAMLRYVLQTRIEDFIEWLKLQEGQPVKTPTDPLPEERS